MRSASSAGPCLSRAEPSSTTFNRIPCSKSKETMIIPNLPFNPVKLTGTLVFAVSYLVFAFGHIPGTRIDRKAMSILGGTLMVALGVLKPRQALDAVDFPTLILLLGMMLLSAGLEHFPE